VFCRGSHPGNPQANRLNWTLSAKFISFCPRALAPARLVVEALNQDQEPQASGDEPGDRGVQLIFSLPMSAFGVKRTLHGYVPMSALTQSRPKRVE
jgi:hypothetical protein